MGPIALFYLILAASLWHLPADGCVKTLLKDIQNGADDRFACAWGKGAPNKNAFNERYARQMFHLAAAAYAADTAALTRNEIVDKQKQCLKKSTRRWKHWTYQVFHEVDCLGGTCSFFAVSNHRSRELVVAFRGTATLKQLVYELYMGIYKGVRFPSDPAKPFWGKIHPYFGNVLENIWPLLRRMLKFEFSGYSVTFTGHSLGGALAALAAAQTRVEELRRSDQIRLYTFGQPRIGSYRFAMKHSEEVPNSFRIVHGEDGVAHVGPCDKEPLTPERRRWYYEFRGVQLARDLKQCRVGQFYHQGTEVWYERGMSLDLRDRKVRKKVCDGFPLHEDISCSSGIPMKRSSIMKYIDDHKFYYGQLVSLFGISGCSVEGTTEQIRAREKAGETLNEEFGEQVQEQNRVIEDFGKLIEEGVPIKTAEIPVKSREWRNLSVESGEPKLRTQSLDPTTGLRRLTPQKQSRMTPLNSVESILFSGSREETAREIEIESAENRDTEAAAKRRPNGGSLVMNRRVLIDLSTLSAISPPKYSPKPNLAVAKVKRPNALSMYNFGLLGLIAKHAKRELWSKGFFPAIL